MTSILEKPTEQVLAPVKLAEVINPALSKVAMGEQPEGRNDLVSMPVQTREEYRLNNEPSLDSTKLDDAVNANKATLDSNEDDEKVQTELFSGFNINDATQGEDVAEDIDELPEDLKDELGEPDDDDEIDDAA